ncbi:RING/FYVE/PHD zinc finger superfamily protein [Forsythia ovata]|uniref:RING/FYVE/PHD zinc finger superfamily protein n=1 Tax=Forsythia ovata TaxID=205694 RepID=A0ABD1S9A0_9LAMI
MISLIVGIDKSRNDENLKVEKVCRICHFGNEKTISGSSEVISHGCDCKGELGFSQKHCAETWFGQRENRLCEICGKTVKNITSNLEDSSIFMMEWNEMRMVATTLDTSQESSRRCKKSMSNFLMACSILAFVLPWFFRVDIL